MILFVCTGNTCRSPLAAALAKARGVSADSAGLVVAMGSPAAAYAVRSAARRGADLSGHRAKPVTAALIDGAECVYTMTKGQAFRLRSLFPEHWEKIRALRPEVPDPYGGEEEDYELCAERILTALKNAGIL